MSARIMTMKKARAEHRRIKALKPAFKPWARVRFARDNGRTDELCLGKLARIAWEARR